jgi:hypothetical protein
MRDLSAVLDHEEPCPLRHVIKRSRFRNVGDLTS